MVALLGLDRRELIRFIREVDEELATITSRHHDMVIGGGAAIALLWNERRLTNDIDVVSEGMTPELRKAIGRVAAANSQQLKPGWFNDAAKVAAPQMGITNPILVFDGLRLHLYVAPAKYLLLMKLFAARAGDTQDILTLIREEGIESPDELYDLVAEGYGRQLLRPQIAYRIEEVWDMHTRSQERDDPEEQGTSGRLDS